MCHVGPPPRSGVFSGPESRSGGLSGRVRGWPLCVVCVRRRLFPGCVAVPVLRPVRVQWEVERRTTSIPPRTFPEPRNRKEASRKSGRARKLKSFRARSRPTSNQAMMARAMAQRAQPTDATWVFSYFSATGGRACGRATHHEAACACTDKAKPKTDEKNEQTKPPRVLRVLQSCSPQQVQVGLLVSCSFTALRTLRRRSARRRARGVG